LCVARSQHFFFFFVSSSSSATAHSTASLFFSFRRRHLLLFCYCSASFSPSTVDCSKMAYRYRQLFQLVLVLSAIWTATAQNANCALVVPPNPLSAEGLATPYYLTALDPADGPCNQANPDQTTFVQGAIIDLDTGRGFVYNPLVIDLGTRPLIAPVVPRLPKNYVAGLWFGTNADTLTLLNTEGTLSLEQGACMNGGGNKFSIFGQFASCNAVLFFDAANTAIERGQLRVPHRGTARDGKQCPTTRDFSVVDQDQSDNVNTKYLLKSNSHSVVVQDTKANRKALGAFTVLENGSDNLLLTDFILPALGCSPWVLPDLADPGSYKPALPFNELMAAKRQTNHPALVPIGDPMVLDADGNEDINKLNSYRLAVDQPVVQCANEASTKEYCRLYVRVGAARILRAKRFFLRFASPDAAFPNLFAFLVARFNATYGPDNLNCTGLLGAPSPLQNEAASGTSDHY
jgi:hypothetical protein